MTTEASIGHGADWQRGDGASPEEFTTVGEILSINGFSLTKDVVDATHMASPGRWEEIISSIKRTGEMAIEVNFRPGDDADAAIADVDSDSPKNYKMVFPDESEWELKCHAVGFEFDVPLDDKMTGTFTYKPTGKPAFIDA